MAGIRVRANLPIGANPNMAYALIPVPVESARAWQSRGAIHGAPGTEPIAAPAPFPAYDKSPVALVSEGYLGLPSSAFTHWYPPIYYETDWPEHAPVRFLNQSHELPVPAVQASNYIVSRGVNEPGGHSQFEPGAFLARLGGSQIPQPSSIGRQWP